MHGQQRIKTELWMFEFPGSKDAGFGLPHQCRFNVIFYKTTKISWRRQNIFPDESFTLLGCYTTYRFRLSGFLGVEDGTDRLSWNICKKLPFLVRNNPEDRSSHILRGGSQISCIIFLIQLRVFIIYETVNPKIYSNYHALAEAFKNHTVHCYLWWWFFACWANLAVDDGVQMSLNFPDFELNNVLVMVL